MKKKAMIEADERILGGLRDALAYHRGELKGVVERDVLSVRDVACLKPPARMVARDVAALRTSMGVSQAAFARILNVSPRTVQAWEANTRQPSDAALKLLSVAKKHPEALVE